MSKRHEARMVVLQALYEADSSAHDLIKVLSRSITETKMGVEESKFAQELISGIQEHSFAIDSQIQSHASAWPIDHMAIIDRNILRLAIYELLHNNEVPVRVVINEAVELAKEFGADSSPRFINGVLNSVSKSVTR